MTRRTLRLFAALLALGGATGCLGDQATWYEQRCLNYGLQRGSADFDACVARDRQWIEQERARVGQPGGRN